MGMGRRGRSAVVAIALMGLGLGLWAPARAAPVAQPGIAQVTAPGSPFLTLGGFDLKAQGYVVEEFIISGTATSYRLKGEPTPDGAWNAEPDGTAPYATRIAICESNLNPTAYSRTHDIGLFQINQVNWGWIRAEFGYTFEDLKDPYKNARVAKVIRDRAGWRAWSCSRKV